MNKYSQLEKIPRDYGIKCILYTSKIHTIDMIGKNPDIKVSDLIKKLDITKGAVPKIIRKLESRDLIFRYQADENKKEVLLKLTGKGETAYRGHKRYHKTFNRLIMKKLNMLNTKQKKFLYDIFNEFEVFLNELLEK
jgi:DNA-binding MarR family transcriptional regulator